MRLFQNPYEPPHIDGIHLHVTSLPERCRAMGRRSRALIDQWSYAEDLAGLRAALTACLATRAPAEALA